MNFPPHSPAVFIPYTPYNLTYQRFYLFFKKIICLNSEGERARVFCLVCLHDWGPCLAQRRQSMNIYLMNECMNMWNIFYTTVKLSKCEIKSYNEIRGRSSGIDNIPQESSCRTSFYITNFLFSAFWTSKILPIEGDRKSFPLSEYTEGGQKNNIEHTD